jgi:O-antigen/teichoic acid export membrane protein
MAAGVLNAERKHWEIFFVRLVGSTGRILLPLAVGFFATMSVLNLSAGFMLHGLVIIALIWVVFSEARVSAPASVTQQTEWKRELIAYGRPFAFVGIGGWLLTSADRWIVEAAFGAEQAGLFAYASGIGAMVSTLAAGGLMQFVFPMIFRGADSARTKGDWHALARKSDHATLAYLLLLLIGLQAVIWLEPWLVGPLISEEYKLSLGMLFAAGCATAAVPINQFHCLLLQGQHNSAGMVRIILTVAALRTAGSIVAASISWTAFITWLMISLPIGGWIGRSMIRRSALRQDPPAGSAMADEQIERSQLWTN